MALKLERKHLLESLKMAREATESQKILSEKAFEELLVSYISMSTRLQLEINDNESKELRLMKKMKNLSLTVRLYKEQIEKHNRRIKNALKHH